MLMCRACCAAPGFPPAENTINTVGIQHTKQHADSQQLLLQPWHVLASDQMLQQHLVAASPGWQVAAVC
jgi:hypothetical protein